MINNVLLVKIEGPGAGIPSIIIYLLLKGFLQTPLLINQPMGKGHLWYIMPTYKKTSKTFMMHPQTSPCLTHCLTMFDPC
jgi:hypothetical protein